MNKFNHEFDTSGYAKLENGVILTSFEKLKIHKQISNLLSELEFETYKLKGHECHAKQWIYSLIELNKKLKKLND